MAELELSGMEELLQKLNELGEQGKVIEENAIKKGALVMQQAAKQEAPRDTGNLINSIKISPIKTKNNTAYVWVGDIDRKAEYGWYLEYGTSKMKANPWLSRAFDSCKNEIKDTIADEIRKGLGL